MLFLCLRKKMLKTFTSIVFCVIAISALTKAQTSGPKDEQAVPKTPKKINVRPTANSAKTPPAEPFDNAKIETMRLQCVKLETEAGAIEAEMFPENALETVRNFLNLVAIGAFDTTTFSRVVPGFVVQGGNLFTRLQKTSELLARGNRTIPDELSLVKHERGVLSMARPEKPNSASSHFFILVGDAPHLDATFSAFGRVTSGMEVVDAINKMPVEGDKPVKPVRLLKATVVACQPKTEP